MACISSQQGRLYLKCKCVRQPFDYASHPMFQYIVQAGYCEETRGLIKHDRSSF